MQDIIKLARFYVMAVQEGIEPRQHGIVMLVKSLASGLDSIEHVNDSEADILRDALTIIGVAGEAELMRLGILAQSVDVRDRIKELLNA